MTDGSAATFTANYHAADAARNHMVLRFKTIPWARVIVDAILALSLLLASSSLLTVR